MTTQEKTLTAHAAQSSSVVAFFFMGYSHSSSSSPATNNHQMSLQFNSTGEGCKGTMRYPSQERENNFNDHVDFMFPIRKHLVSSETGAKLYHFELIDITVNFIVEFGTTM